VFNVHEFCEWDESCGDTIAAIVTSQTGTRLGVCQKHLMEVDGLNLQEGVHREHCPCAKCTLKRLPTINDPFISEALRNVGL